MELETSQLEDTRITTVTGSTSFMMYTPPSGSSHSLGKQPLAPTPKSAASTIPVQLIAKEHQPEPIEVDARSLGKTNPGQLAKNTSSEILEKTTGKEKVSENRENSRGANRNLVMHYLADKEKNWANIFSSNRLAAKGMSLKYVAPMIKEGEKIVQLRKEDVEKETEKWKTTVILYVVGDTPTIGALKRFIKAQ